MNNQYQIRKVQVKSKLLNRQTFYNIATPGKLDEEELYPLLIWLHGWGDQPECPNLLEALETLPWEFNKPVVVFPWGMEGKECSEWVDRLDGSLSMESHVIKELVPHLLSTYPIEMFPHSIMIGGVSMGGFGAVNMALKYQDLFCAAAATSPQGFHWPKELPPKDEEYPPFLKEHIPGLTTPYEAAHRIWGDLPENLDHLLQNSPMDYIDEMEVEIGFYLDSGNEGFEEHMRDDTLSFTEKLRKKQVHHVFEQLNGQHAIGLNRGTMQRKLLFMLDQFEMRRILAGM